MIAISNSIGGLEEEQERHTYRIGGFDSSVSPAEYLRPTQPVFERCNSSDSTYCYYVQSLQEEDDAEVKRRHALEMRKRDLGYLWTSKPVPRLRFVPKRPPVIFQPCWSSRRWRSVT